MDSHLEKQHRMLLRDLPVMVWLVSPKEDQPLSSESPVPRKASGVEATSSFVIVKTMEPVRVHLNDQELLFLNRVIEDSFRNSLVGEDGCNAAAVDLMKCARL